MKAIEGVVYESGASYLLIIERVAALSRLAREPGAATATGALAGAALTLAGAALVATVCAGAGDATGAGAAVGAAAAAAAGAEAGDTTVLVLRVRVSFGGFSGTFGEGR